MINFNFTKILICSLIGIYFYNALAEDPITRSPKELFGTSKSDYVILSPKVFRPGSPYKLSVLILNPAWSNTDFVFQIVDVSGRAIAKAESYFEPGHFTTTELQIPISVDPDIYYDLKISYQPKGVKATRSKSAIPLERKRLILRPLTAALFIQLDKSYYMSDQIVNFRVISVLPDLTPYKGDVDIYVENAQRNRVAQWLAESSDYGVITKEFVLGHEPMIGKWSVHAYIEGEHEVSKTFEVNDIQLPVFEVKLEVAIYQIIGNDVVGTIEALYKFGKRVHGQGVLSAWFQNTGTNNCSNEKIVKDVDLMNGLNDFALEWSILDNICPDIKGAILNLHISVIDEATKIQNDEFTVTKFFLDPLIISFSSNNPTTFKPGIPYIGHISVLRPDNTPLPNYEDKRLTIQASGGSDSKPFFTKEYAIDESGIVVFEISIPQEILTLVIKAELTVNSRLLSTLMKINQIQESYSNTFLSLNLLSQNMGVNEVGTFEIRCTHPMHEVFYMVLSRGTIVHNGVIYVGGKNFMTFYVPITADMIPISRIIAFFIQDQELIVDAINFRVDGAFKNGVEAVYDPPVIPPHTETELKIKSNPDSLVCILALDKRLEIYSNHYDVTPFDINLAISQFDTTYGAFQLAQLFDKTKSNYLAIGGKDPTAIIDQAGLIVFTDADFSVGRSSEKINITPLNNKCIQDCTHHPFVSIGGLTEELGYVRKYFPDTWIWTCQNTNKNGEVSIKEISPDYLTHWITSIFSIHPTYGLGIAPITTAQVFSTFFTHVKAPTYVILGEVVIIQVTVFNYGTIPLKSILVELRNSPQFENILKDGSGRSGVRKGTIPYIKPNRSGILLFPIKPIVLGTIELYVDSQSHLATDSSIKTFEVKLGGLAHIITDSLFLDLKQSSKCSLSQETMYYEKAFTLNYPPNIIEGSLEIGVAITGDVLGPVINGFTQEKFLDFMPTGCAEQNLVYFGPLVYVVRYLTATHQAEDSFRQKAQMFLQKGYAIELGFQRTDGSFATFPPLAQNLALVKTDDNLTLILPTSAHNIPSTWLTAFVCKLFNQATPYIYIDSKIIERGIEWLISRQKEDGSFAEDGTLLLKSIQGFDAKTPIALTAFVVISLLENSHRIKAINKSLTSVIEKSLRYLETSLPDLQGSEVQSYKLAIVCYCLALAEKPIANECMNYLISIGIVNQNQLYWKAQIGNNERESIEMTGYNLLTLMKIKRMDVAAKVAHWLVTKQSQFGEYHSTQDTIIALQALSTFSEVTFCPNPSFKVRVRYGGDKDTENEFKVDSSNVLLYQSIHLPTTKSPLPSTLLIKAAGQGVGLLQITTKYHVPESVATKGTREVKKLSSILKAVDIKSNTIVEPTIKKLLNKTGSKNKTLPLTKIKNNTTKASLNNLTVFEKFSTPPFITTDVISTTIVTDLKTTEVKKESKNVETIKPFTLLIVSILSNETLGIKACTKWNLQEPSESGFTMLEMGIPSGFKPDINSVSLIDVLASVKEEGGKLVFYLNDIGHEQKCLDYKLKRIDLVTKQQPVPCKVYQYYNPEMAVTKFLDTVTERLRNVCDICTEGCVVESCLTNKST